MVGLNSLLKAASVIFFFTSINSLSTGVARGVTGSCIVAASGIAGMELLHMRKEDLRLLPVCATVGLLGVAVAVHRRSPASIIRRASRAMDHSYRASAILPTLYGSEQSMADKIRALTHLYVDQQMPLAAASNDLMARYNSLREVTVQLSTVPLLKCTDHEHATRNALLARIEDEEPQLMTFLQQFKCTPEYYMAMGVQASMNAEAAAQEAAGAARAAAGMAAGAMATTIIRR